MENTTIIARLLAILCLILSGVIAVGTANADSHLPNCKANPKCLLFEDLYPLEKWDELRAKWWAITAAEMQAMINSGADVHAKDNSGDTPLHSAAGLGQAELIPVLVQAGADVNAKADNGWTPLHRASARINTEVISTLLRLGANVNATENIGWTPLHMAAVRGNAEVISVLVKAGAYINATDNSGRTPLDIARQDKQWNAVKILEGGSDLASPSCFNIIRGKPNQVVWVNGIPMKMHIDTGADSTHLTKQQAKMAGVQITGEGEFVIADGSVVVNKTGSANISLGGGLSGKFPVSIGKGKGLLGRDVLDEFACQ